MLAEFGGVPLIRRSVEIATLSESGSVVVVTGHRYAEIRGAIDDLPVVIVHNPDFIDGMATSITVGVGKAVEEAEAPDGILILLADMPALTVRDLNMLVKEFRRHEGGNIVQAVSDGVPGNPVIFPRAFYPEILRMKGDKGAREIVRQSGLTVVNVEIGEGAKIDVDTPEEVVHAGGESGGAKVCHGNGAIITP